MSAKWMSRLNTRGDVLYFFALNVASAFMLSAAHNVLYFVLDIKTFVIHFLHYFSTFIFLYVFRFARVIPEAPIENKDLKAAVVWKFFETLLAGFAHSQSRTGELYLVRIFDCLFTLSIVSWNRIMAKPRDTPEDYLVLPLAFATSLAWLEWGQMEYTTTSLICAALLPIARAIAVLHLQAAYEKCGRGHADNFAYHYVRLVAVALLPLAVASFFSRNVGVTASWESIDYTLMALSFLFMACFLYSELWLLLHVNLNAFSVCENTKYLTASIAQWIIQNMAHPNLLAFGGKLVAGAALFRLVVRS